MNTITIPNFSVFIDLIKCIMRPFSYCPKPIKSKTGFLTVDANGVARVDYSNPEARQKLAEQIEFFSKIDLKP